MARRNQGRVFAALKAMMATFPNQRVAQGLYNALQDARPPGLHWPTGSNVENANYLDFFNVEDNDLAECLERYVKEHRS